MIYRFMHDIAANNRRSRPSGTLVQWCGWRGVKRALGHICPLPPLSALSCTIPRQLAVVMMVVIYGAIRTGLSGIGLRNL